jgi:hypothetical protein
MTVEKALQDIKKNIPLKKDTNIGDIALVGTPDGIFYASVREIKQDFKKKWFNVRFTMLVLPPVELTWTLRQPQMCGELFTINNDDHFMIAVDLESESEPTENHPRNRDCENQPDQTGKVLQLIQKTARKNDT